MLFHSNSPSIIHKFLSIILLILCLLNFSLAQSGVSTKKQSIPGAIINFGIPYSFFHGQKMEEQGVGDGLGMFSLGFDLLFNDLFLLGLEIGWDSPNDNKEITNITTSGKMTSSISYMQFALLAGLKSPNLYFSENSNPYMFGNMNFGYMWAFFEMRKIENCLDCDDEKLDINGGMFINPEIYYVFDVVSLGLSYTHFFNSDYKAKIQLKLAAVLN